MNLFKESEIPGLSNLLKPQVLEPGFSPKQSYSTAYSLNHVLTKTPWFKKAWVKLVTTCNTVLTNWQGSNSGTPNLSPNPSTLHIERNA